MAAELPYPLTNKMPSPADAPQPQEQLLNATAVYPDLQPENDGGSSSPPVAGVSPMSFWGRIAFQKMLLFSVARLSIYLLKLYEDVATVKEYNIQRQINFLLISVACLIVPPLFYAIYLIGSNLAKDDILNKTEIGTKAVNGLLLIPWQIKRHLDVLHFSAQRVCVWKSPDEDEEQDLQSMKRNAEILEFFEDLYAGFLQIFLQLYLFFRSSESISSSDTSLEGLFIREQLVASILCVFSMLIAVRRRDDGPLTGFLSYCGWSCLIVSRILVFTLVSIHIHGWFFIICLIHVLAVSIWVYKIAIESFMATTATPSEATAQWTHRRKRLSLAVLVFLFFGIPSLLIWPIMFQLKEGRRPLIFLMVITLENLFLLGIWFICELSSSGLSLSNHHVLLVVAIVMTTLAGVFFLLIYVFCKPKYTDQVVLYEIRESRTSDAPTFIKLTGINTRSLNATQYGIYYEFCDLVFKLPSTHKIAAGLTEIRQQM